MTDKQPEALCKPTGKLAFAYQTIATLEQARADLEAEVARLREALEELLRHFTRSPSSLADSETRIKAHAALKEQP